MRTPGTSVAERNVLHAQWITERANDRERRARAAARRVADAHREKLSTALSLLRTDRVQALRLHIEWLLDEHRIAVVWMPDATRARANPESRRVWLPVVTSAARAAVCYHELAHVVANRCAACARHPVTPCLACETRAWRTAAQLAPAFFSFEMHYTRQLALDGYVRSPRTLQRDASEEAARLTSTRAWADARLNSQRT